MENELKKLAATMRDMSDMVGDHHWQAAKAIEQLAQRDAEIERLRRFEVAYLEWQEKTDWVQADAKPKELGKHRADVLRERINALSVNHRKSGFCGDPYVHDCGRNDCPLSDSFKAPGK